jgi:hypothetical protein
MKAYDAAIIGLCIIFSTKIYALEALQINYEDDDQPSYLLECSDGAYEIYNGINSIESGSDYQEIKKLYTSKAKRSDSIKSVKDVGLKYNQLAKEYELCK